MGESEESKPLKEDVSVVVKDVQPLSEMLWLPGHVYVICGACGGALVSELSGSMISRGLSILARCVNPDCRQFERTMHIGPFAALEIKPE